MSRKSEERASPSLVWLDPRLELLNAAVTASQSIMCPSPIHITLSAGVHKERAALLGSTGSDQCWGPQTEFALSH